MGRQRRGSRGGFTLTEMVVVTGTVAILVSLILPAMTKVRARARFIQCQSNLRQLGQALTMYDMDNDRLIENYPDRLTNLFAGAGNPGSYVMDPRIFVCPMDYTNAQGTTLKPGNPRDNKAEWAERQIHGNGEMNCSYLYEFSGRPCQTFTDDATDSLGDWDEDSPSSFAEWYMVAYDPEDPFTAWYTDPKPMDRDGYRYKDVDGTNKGVITWQEAKFWQLEVGDIYISGLESGDGDNFPAPPGDFVDPYDYWWDNDLPPQHGYPRTWLPIVRCFWHQTPQLVDKEDHEEVLNLALDGNLFLSAPFWERTSFKYGKQIDESIQQWVEEGW